MDETQCEKKFIFLITEKPQTSYTAVSVQFFINMYVQLSVKGKKVECIVNFLLEAIMWPYSKAFSHPKQKWMEKQW